MIKANNGDAVSVHYTGRLVDGTTFDSSEGHEPLNFVIGKGQMIQGFEEGILGMSVGEKKTIQMPPHKAYGEADPNMMFPVSKADLPQDMPLQVGISLTAQSEDGQPFQVFLKEVHADHVVLDANHPLAGMDLIFDVELLSINGNQNEAGLIY
jgi:peptidylprolyl isomerase